jgi:uncharacterized ion transporter superfamily protein YfcC
MSRFRFPHPLTLLVGCIAVAVLLTWMLPAGQYDRAQDEATGRNVVVPGTYHQVEARPVGPFAAAVSVPRGLIDAAEVVFLVFLVGGAFYVIDRTGALRSGLDSLARVLGHREVLIIPICSLLFATGGILENMQEEIIALIPMLLLLTRRLGFDALTAVAMSLGAAMVGSAFSPINPFQVGIAQKIAQIPLLSGGMFRIAFLVPALAIWIAGTMRHAGRHRVATVWARDTVAPERTEIGGRSGDATVMRETDVAPAGETLSSARATIILLMVLAAFTAFVVGLTWFDWGFNELSAVFFVTGVLAGLVGRLGINGTASAFAEGFREMAFAALLIGFARAIFVVLEDGRIIDTIVHGLFTPIATMPRTVAMLGVMSVQSVIHVLVPSVSGQAVLTMPILVPLADLLGVTRQVMVLAYHFGAGLCDVITPTNGALLAILAAAGVRFDQWLSFSLRLWIALMALGGVAIITGMLAGLS